jgi:Protein of unknown function (DUF3014)
MNENFKWGAAAVAVVGLSIGAFVYLSRGDRAAPPAQTVAAVPAQPAPPAEPAIKHPIPASGTQAALPLLDDSDGAAQNALADLIGQKSVEQFVVTKDLVRHIVVTIDNLSEQKVAERLRPVQPVAGKFAVAGTEEAPVLDPANYERYQPVVQLIRSIDMQRLAATYARYYPLFQESYESLGHPPQYFNDRLVEVIDHLLATPDIQGPIALAQPSVQYEFADPKLESLSAGQKALIRMGSANASSVKDKLRELRSVLLAQRPGH